MNTKGKLIRDNIPAIIQSRGRTAVTHTADSMEYEGALLNKLREEVEEFCVAPSMEELADIEEVVEAIIQQKGYSRKDLTTVQISKRTKNGAFTKKIILESID